jgi:hypothetical protein
MKNVYVFELHARRSGFDELTFSYFDRFIGRVQRQVRIEVVPPEQESAEWEHARYQSLETSELHQKRVEDIRRDYAKRLSDQIAEQQSKEAERVETLKTELQKANASIAELGHRRSTRERQHYRNGCRLESSSTAKWPASLNSGPSPSTRAGAQIGKAAATDLASSNP